MFESYPWPKAYGLKEEAQLIIRQFQEMFDGVIKEISKSKKNEKGI